MSVCSFYKDIEVIDTILGKDLVVKKAPEIKYPSYQKVKILTVHLRRLLVPRQINIAVQSKYQDSPEIKVLMKEKGIFSNHFKNKVFSRAVKETGICKHCVVGAWAYIRVGVDTHLLWLKGEGKNIDYVKEN